MCSVLCSSSWLCPADITSVLHVCTGPEDTAEAPAREKCVALEVAPPGSDGVPCTVSLRCAAPATHAIQGVRLCSQARTIEVYSVSQEGREEEYLGTSRGDRLCSYRDDGEDAPITMYSAQLTLHFPVSSCNIKLLSLGGRQSVLVAEISVQVKPVPERCPQMPPPLLGSSINMDHVQNMMDSMGGKISPGAEQLMNMVRAQQKNQLPFGAHLLQLFGGFQPDRGQKKEQSAVETLPTSRTCGTSPEAAQNQASAHPAPSAIDVRSIMSSLLQNQMGQTAKPEPHLPPLQNLSIHKSPAMDNGRESCVMPREEKLDPALEKLLSTHMERMERNLMDHVDRRMKRLQEHLDTRLDQLLHVIENGNSVTSSVTTGVKLVNGHIDHTDEEDHDCDVVGVH